MFRLLKFKIDFLLQILDSKCEYKKPETIKRLKKKKMNICTVSSMVEKVLIPSINTDDN